MYRWIYYFVIKQFFLNKTHLKLFHLSNLQLIFLKHLFYFIDSLKLISLIDGNLVNLLLLLLLFSLLLAFKYHSK